ncbi:MAG: hypothetical protein ACRDK0_12290 [Solirubrobacteraceae bacterium]
MSCEYPHTGPTAHAACDVLYTVRPFPLPLPLRSGVTRSIIPYSSASSG